MRNGSLKGLVLFALAAAGLARAADLPKPIEDTRQQAV